jgi:hypothetical protein
VCGIVGILVRDSVLPTDLLAKATSSLSHRNPDDRGTVILRETSPEPVEVGLCSRGLAILDLSPLGHQPMLDAETGNWIIHNLSLYSATSRSTINTTTGKPGFFRKQKQVQGSFVRPHSAHKRNVDAGSKATFCSTGLTSFAVLYSSLLRLGCLDGIPGQVYCGFQAVEIFHTNTKIHQARSKNY